jgi:signal transduction histidine kinase
MAELRRIGEELRSANSMKDELLGLVSHELRTPLTGILGCSHLLLRRFAQLSREDREMLLRDISDHGARLQRLIENMLVLSRAETAAETNTEPLLLQRVLPPVLEGMQPLEGRRQLQVWIEPGLPPVTANPVFVEQIVTNLIRNSEKYAAEDADVEVRLESAESSVAMTVADRGSQLTATEVNRMFDAFYRDPSGSPKASGLGLGLPVCKRLTEVQGGSISARPRPGGGLEVTVALPTARE